MTTTTTAKIALRRELRARLATLTKAQLHDAGVAIAAHLAALVPMHGTVALFASRDGELDTAPLDELCRARGLRRLVPRIDGDDLVFCVVVGAVHDLPRDRLGIPTPDTSAVVASIEEADVVVVPGLGFDEFGGRIGYGRGFYDRALAGVSSVVVGVFADEQRVDRVPMDAHDVRLPRLCTPRLGLINVDGDVDK